MINNNFNEIHNVWQRWNELAEKFPEKEAIVHWTIENLPIRWTYSSLIKKANFYSNKLLQAGIKRNEVCAIIIRHNPEFYPLYMGIVGIGALPAVLAFPNRKLHPDKFREALEGMSQRSGLDWILTERALDETIRPLAIKKDSTIKEILFPLEFDHQTSKELDETISLLRKSFRLEDPLLLQHSSGTTGLQKPVMLSNRAVLEHVRIYGNSIGLNENDKIVSWLPLYHDMGLIATFHLPLTFGIPLIKLDPFEWILGPEILLDAITKEKGTLTWLPNFAYNVLTDKIYDDELANFDLSFLRMVINCSEPIRHHSHQIFYNKFKNCGLKRTALSTCYAMAETTFAVTQNPPDSEIRIIPADLKSFNKGIIKISNNPDESRICVSSGKLIEGCFIKIVDERNNELSDGNIGEIAIRSTSMFDGYRNYPEKTAAVLKNGWYYTGDLGFKWEEDYFVIGRKKDVIIVAGKNVYPEDIEDAVNNVKGIIPGRVIAFGEDNEELGTQEVNIIAETNVTEEKEKKRIIQEIKSINSSLEISVRNVYLVPPKWLIKSSAGKPSRSANKERILKSKKAIFNKIKTYKYLSVTSLILAAIFLMLGLFFFIKNTQTTILISELVNDTLPEQNNLNTEKKVLLLAKKIYTETNRIEDPEELDWYSLFEIKNLWGINVATGLEYKCFAVKSVAEPDKSEIMTRILLLSLWQIDIPARRIVLNLNNSLDTYSMVEFYYDGEWKLISVADNAFVWRNRFGEIASTNEIRKDSVLLSQIKSFNPNWSFTFDDVTHINWEILPQFIKIVYKAILGEAAFENSESPRVLERPRQLAFFYSCFLTAVFLFIYLIITKKQKSLLNKLNNLIVA